MFLHWLIMQMSWDVLECVIEYAKDCLAPKCQGEQWLTVNVDGLHVQHTLNHKPEHINLI